MPRRAGRSDRHAQGAERTQRAEARRETAVALLCVLSLSLPVSLTPALEGSAAAADPVERFVGDSFDVGRGEFANVRTGQIVARTLPARDSREVATFGLARIQMTPEFCVRQISNITSFKRDEAVLQIGVFGDPPDLPDIGRLTLDEGDLKSLRACRVGHCAVQLPADAIERFQREVDWRKADASDRANQVMRQILVAYVTEYRRLGSAAPMRYADRSPMTDMPREFVSLADGSPALWQPLPALHRHLFHYPERTGGATDVLYWSKEKMGRKAVIGLTHLAIVPIGGESPVDYAVASRHLFGTHYLDASLGLTLLLRDRSSPTPATYLVYTNRTRVDVFGGVFGGMVRKIVTSRARSTVSDQLSRLRNRLETQFAARPVS